MLTEKSSNQRSKIKFLPPALGTFQSNSSDDPLRYYYHTLVGGMFRQRIQLGLDLLGGPYEQILEFGYGSGLLLPTLSKMCSKLYAIDITTAPAMVHESLTHLGIQAMLLKDDIVEADLPKAQFDLIVAFSVFEHIHHPGDILKCMHGLLKSNGELLVGMPMVSPVMDRLFPLIGYLNIQDSHVLTHNQFMNEASALFSLTKRVHMPRFLPTFAGLYFNMLFRKK